MQLYEQSGSRSNRLLQALSPQDGALLETHLESITLEKDEVCIEPNVPIGHVHFLDGGMGSTVMPDKNHGTTEIGAQGFEGLIGIPIVLGTDRTPHKTFMQVGGPARRIPVKPLQDGMEKSDTLRRVLTLYAHVFLLQVGRQTIECHRCDACLGRRAAYQSRKGND